MEQNPLNEQQNRINAEKDKLKKELYHLFDDKKGELVAKINNLILLIEVFKKNGLVINKEEIVKELKEAIQEKDRETFVSRVFKVLEPAVKPIVTLKITQPKVFSKIQRESYVGDFKDKTRLSEFLYYGISENKKIAHIHLLHVKDFMIKDKIEDFQKDIEEGLSKLADIVRNDKNIEKITATSWIVAIKGSAKRLEKMGFTIIGPISEETREKHFKEEEKPVAEAFINREDFLAKYPNKETK